MKLAELSRLEKLARSRAYRLKLMGASGITYLPGLDERGVTFDRAQSLLARVNAIAHLGYFADPVIVGPDLMPIGTTPPPAPTTTPPPSTSRIASLAAAEGIDMSLLVNPDALEGAFGDISIIR